MTYQLYVTPGQTNPNGAMTIESTPQVSFIFAPTNPDYQAFKTALQTGKNLDGTDVVLNDASGTAMTADQITTFLGTLP